VSKVLMVAYHFPPITSGGVRRSVKFARYLLQFGWEPVVLSVDSRSSLYRQWKKGVSDQALGGTRIRAYEWPRLTRRLANVLSEVVQGAR